MIIKLPFSGFYESWYSDDLDRAEEDFLESYCEENDISEKVKAKLVDRMYKFSDYKAMEMYIAEGYVDAFDNYMSEKLELDGGLGLTFSDMSSPKEYNFATDRIFAHITEEKVQELRDCLSIDELSAAIKKRFTSYDGFISFYSNRIEDWLDRPLIEWDHNELGTLLYALWDNDDDYAVYNKMDERNYMAFDQGFDFQRIEQEVKELQLVESGECEDDGRVFPLGVTDPQVYVDTYTKMNGLKS